MRDALVSTAITKLQSRPDIADRAATHFVEEILGKQENREEVMRAAMEELASEGPTPAEERLAEHPSIDEDWLNSFSRYAELASSDRLRAVFGKVLAGEIRRPGAFSFFALDLLSKIGQREAALIARIAPFRFHECIPRTKRTAGVLDYGTQQRLGEIGVLTTMSIGPMSATTTFRMVGVHPSTGRPCNIVVSGRHVMIIEMDTPESVSIDCSVLTSVGVELLDLYPAEPDLQMMVEVAGELDKKGARLILADLVSRNATTAKWKNARLVVPPKPAAPSS
jgi:hypothetical protein